VELACEWELHERLSSLLAELEPYEPKLIQLNKKMKIKLRKEHENYVEEPPDKQQVRCPSIVYYAEAAVKKYKKIKDTVQIKNYTYPVIYIEFCVKLFSP